MTLHSSYVFVIVARNNGELDSPIGNGNLEAGQKVTTASGSEKPKQVNVVAKKGTANGASTGTHITLTLTTADTGKTHKGETAKIVQYTIYWKAGDSNSIPTDLKDVPRVVVETTNKAATTYTFGTSENEKLQSETEYAFVIKATNNAGKQSDVSNTATATTDDAPPELRGLWTTSWTTLTATFNTKLDTADDSKFKVTTGHRAQHEKHTQCRTRWLLTKEVKLTLANALSGREEITLTIEADAVTSKTNQKNKEDSKKGNSYGGSLQTTYRI